MQFNILSYLGADKSIRLDEMTYMTLDERGFVTLHRKFEFAKKEVRITLPTPVRTDGALNALIDTLGGISCATSAWIAVTPENPIPERVKDGRDILVMLATGHRVVVRWQPGVKSWVRYGHQCEDEKYFTHYAELTEGAGK